MKENKTKEIKNEDLAYMAGILDGEGSLFISKTKKDKDDVRVRYQAGIKIGMNDSAALLVFQKYFGGNINIGSKKVKVADGSEYTRAYILQYSSESKIIEILSLLTPFLKVKKEQSEILTSFIISKKLFNMSLSLMGNKSAKGLYYGRLNNFYLKSRAAKKRNWLRIGSPAKKIIANKTVVR